MRWAPFALDFPQEPKSRKEDELVDRLFGMAAKAAPAELVRWVSRQADLILAADCDLPYALRKLNDIRDPRLAEPVLAKLGDGALSPRAHAGALAWVVEREPERAVKRVEPYLTAEAIAASSEGRARAIRITIVLLELLPATGWPLVKRFLAEEKDLAVDVLLAAAAVAPNFDAIDLPASQLPELVETVFDLLPPNAAVPGNADDELGLTQDDLDRMRGRLLVTLAERGADESVGLVEELHHRYPEAVPASLIGDAKAARRSRWNALDPRHVGELCHANTARLVFDDRGLQDAVLASLRRIQRSLREGEPPLAYQLWNSETGRPEYEEWISNWLAERLQVDLTTGGRVINREVQAAMSSSGKGRAKSVDIKVTAPTGKLVEEAANATVLIEVKGGWHGELRSAMKDQLAERYLLRSGHCHGIYLVLWFPLDEGFKGDRRSRWDGGMSFEEAEDFFREQAGGLSASGRVSVRAFVLDGSK